MSNNHDTIARNIFQERIRKGLLGPGSDVFVDNNIENNRNNEIISDYPLQRYYTGILFPERKRENSFDEQADNYVESLTNNDENIESINKNYETEDVESKDENDNKRQKELNQDDEIKISQNTFFPTNLGLTFCVDSNEKELEIDFSFGTYYQLDEKQNKNINECRIKFSESLYNEKIKNNNDFPIILKDKFDYKDGYLFLKKKIIGYKRKNKRSDDYVEFDEYKKEFPNNIETQKIEKILGRKWKREHYAKKEIIPIKNVLLPTIMYEKKIAKDNYLRVSYTVKVLDFISDTNNPNSQYVKIQLINNSTEHPTNQFSNAKELLNSKSIFQAKIKVKAKQLKPYKSHIELNPLDKEAEILNYLYKDKFSYGIGHNCSVSWDKINGSIETTSFSFFK